MADKGIVEICLAVASVQPIWGEPQSFYSKIAVFFDILSRVDQVQLHLFQYTHLQKRLFSIRWANELIMDKYTFTSVHAAPLPGRERNERAIAALADLQIITTSMQAGSATSTMTSAPPSLSAAQESRRSRSSSRAVSRSVSPAPVHATAPPLEVVDASADQSVSRHSRPTVPAERNRYYSTYIVQEVGMPDIPERERGMDRGGSKSYISPRSGPVAVLDSPHDAGMRSHFPPGWTVPGFMPDELPGLGRMDALRNPERMMPPFALDHRISDMPPPPPRGDRVRDMGFYHARAPPVGHLAPPRPWREPSLSRYAPRLHALRYGCAEKYPYDQRALVAPHDRRMLGDPFERGVPNEERRYQIPRGSRRLPHYSANPHGGFDPYGGHMPGHEWMGHPGDFTHMVDMHGSNEREGMGPTRHWRKSSYVHRSSAGGVTSVQRFFVSTNSRGRAL